MGLKKGGIHTLLSLLLALAPLGVLGGAAGCGKSSGGGGGPNTGPNIVTTVTCNSTLGQKVQAVKDGRLITGKVAEKTVLTLASGKTRAFFTVEVAEDDTSSGGGTGGSNGPTTVDVVVDCPDNSGNTTPAPA